MMRCSLVLSVCITTNTIFILIQLQEKYLAKEKNLCFAFVGLEKAFDWLPKNVMLWALRKLGKKIGTIRYKTKYNRFIGMLKVMLESMGFQWWFP